MICALSRNCVLVLVLLVLGQGSAWATFCFDDPQVLMADGTRDVPRNPQLVAFAPSDDASLRLRIAEGVIVPAQASRGADENRRKIVLVPDVTLASDTKYVVEIFPHGIGYGFWTGGDLDADPPPAPRVGRVRLEARADDRPAYRSGSRNGYTSRFIVDLEELPRDLAYAEAWIFDSSGQTVGYTVTTAHELRAVGGDWEFENRLCGVGELELLPGERYSLRIDYYDHAGHRTSGALEEGEVVECESFRSTPCDEVGGCSAGAGSRGSGGAWMVLVALGLALRGGRSRFC